MEAGVDIFTIQKLLGHASLQATSVYIHIQRRNLGQIINPLDRLWEEEP